MTRPEQIGPYEILDQIGEGGMGTVFEGRHQDSGEHVALKTIRSEALGGAHGTRALRREVEVLATLRHPNIVAIVDHDLDGASPWFAMEFIEGRPLSAWYRQTTETISSADTILENAGLTELSNPSADLSEFDQRRASPGTSRAEYPAVEDWDPDPGLRTKLSWIGQIAHALEFLHGNGLVHADVKPDNILIRQDGMPVLVDFGLVSRMERRVTRKSLDRIQTRAQTMEYAAPERLTGAEFDARADIYALGCMLYEIFRGAPPFVGPPAAVAIAHVTSAPDPLDDVDPSPPSGILHLVDRSLQKDPRDRVSYVREFTAVLEDHGIATLPAGITLPESPPYLYQPSMVGFETEVEEVKGCFDRVREPGASHLLKVHGPRGAGKSRFVLSMLATAAQRGWITHVVAPHSEVGSQYPFEAFESIVDELLLRAASDEWRPRSGAFWLGWLDDRFRKHLEADDLEVLEELERYETPESIRATARELALALRESGGPRPILVIAESYESLDPASRTTLGEITRLASTEPWFVLATDRTSNLDEHELELPKLGTADVREIIVGVLGECSIENPVVETIAQLSDGRPGRVLDLLHRLLDQQWIEQDRLGRWHARDSESLESAVAELAHGRAAMAMKRKLASMSEESMRLGQAAAVLGDRFDLTMLAQLTANPIGTVILAMNELFRSNVIADPSTESTRTVRNSLQFSTAVARQMLYESLEEKRCVELHRRAAALQGDSNAAALERARHLEAAGEPEAFRAWLDSAERARLRYAHDVRIKSLEGALRTGTLATERREDLLYERFETIFESTSTQRVRDEARATLDEVENPAIRAQVLRLVCKLALMQTDVEEVRPFRRELEDLVASDDPQTAISANTGMATLHLASDSRAEALPYAEKAMDLAGDNVSSTHQFEAYTVAAETFFYLGKYQPARDAFERALDATKALGEARIQQARGNLSAFDMQFGFPARGRDKALEVAEFQRRARFLWPLLVTVWNVGMASIIMGDLEAALDAHDEFMSLRHQLRLDDDLAPYLRYEARIQRFLGDCASSLELLAEASEKPSSENEKAHNTIEIANTLIHMEDFEAAVRALEDPPDASSPNILRDMRIVQSQAYLGLGDLERAEKILDEWPGLAVENHYSHARYLGELGILRHLQRRFDEAEDKLTAAIEWFEENRCRYPESMYRLAFVRCRQDRNAPLDPIHLARVRSYIATQPFTPNAALVREYARRSAG